MEWKGLSKSVNAERSKGYHAQGLKMMTNVHGLCVCRIAEDPDRLSAMIELTKVQATGAEVNACQWVRYLCSNPAYAAAACRPC
ncbi:hypothetical protein FHJ31_13440 [Pseudomonas sp. Fig-3]|nr:hypothetical protein FHJ31_13440 [Pseudomonas sp. Fig-3]